MKIQNIVLTAPRWCFFCGTFFLFVFRVCRVSLSYGHLLGKGRPLGSLVCDVLLCICYFPMWCPGSGVVLECNNFRSLPSFLPLMGVGQF